MDVKIMFILFILSNYFTSVLYISRELMTQYYYFKQTLYYHRYVCILFLVSTQDGCDTCIKTG